MERVFAVLGALRHQRGRRTGYAIPCASPTAPSCCGSAAGVFAMCRDRGGLATGTRPTGGCLAPVGTLPVCPRERDTDGAPLFDGPTDAALEHRFLPPVLGQILQHRQHTGPSVAHT